VLEELCLSIAKRYQGRRLAEEGDPTYEAHFDQQANSYDIEDFFAEMQTASVVVIG
jgi:hypothetical protein